MSQRLTVPLGDVLTVTTGVMLSSRGIIGLRGLLAFMTGTSNDLDDTSITDTGCQALAPKCAEMLIVQHPWLSEIKGNDVTPDNVDSWLKEITSRYGDTVEVVQFH